MCRYCGQKQEYGEPNKQIKPQEEVVSTKPTISFEEASKLPAGYSPPEEHVELIYQRYTDKLRQGEWRNLGSPPEVGYIRRHYQGKISVQEFSKIKTNILVQGWKSSDKTPKGLSDYIILHPPKTKRGRFSADRLYEQSAINDSIEMLRLRIIQYSEEGIRESYPNKVEYLIRLAFSEEVFGENYESPILKLNSMKFSSASDVPIEYYDLTIIEARNHINELLEKYEVELFVPLSKRPGIMDDMKKRTIRIADKLDSYHKAHYKSDNPYSFIVEFSEIVTAVDEDTMGDDRYDEGASATLCFKVEDELKKRGYM